MPFSQICVAYLAPLLNTPLKPVSLLDDGSSSSPSAAAAALASSAAGELADSVTTEMPASAPVRTVR